MAEKKKLKDKTDKRYRAKITVGHDMYGEPVVKYASGRTKMELEESKAALKQKYKYGLEDTNVEIMFETAAYEWYDVYKKPFVSASSRMSFESALRKHIIPAFQDRQLRSIRAVELQKFMNEHSNMGKSTVGYFACIFSGIFGRALIDGVIHRDPTLGMQKDHAPKIRKRALTENETTAVLKVIDAHEESLLLAILYYTGMRRGEVLGLQWNDVDFNTRTIHVKRDIDFVTNAPGKVKTERSLRDIPIPDELYKVLNGVRGIGDNYVILSPDTHGYLGSSTYKRRWGRLMTVVFEADSSIESKDGKPIITAHYFRHNYASLLYDAGIDMITAASYMGHSVAVMQEIYIHLSSAKKKKNAKKINHAFNLKGCQKVARP